MAMTILERRQFILRHKEERGCARCGAKLPGSALELVRPEGGGVHISRFLSPGTVTDRELFCELRERVCVCRACRPELDRRRVRVMAMREGGSA